MVLLPFLLISCNKQNGIQNPPLFEISSISIPPILPKKKDLEEHILLQHRVQTLLPALISMDLSTEICLYKVRGGITR